MAPPRDFREYVIGINLFPSSRSFFTEIPTIESRAAASCSPNLITSSPPRLLRRILHSRQWRPETRAASRNKTIAVTPVSLLAFSSAASPSRQLHLVLASAFSPELPTCDGNGKTGRRDQSIK
ncbi:unnamed protein product [Cuscuta campestris]|uniref:Uncharacterized protein n=1 Tax=Cuscuta campestris TaxID=132261 RepID=A0A484L4G0_9ASTE|nr:unnamed protein product [Cuscuta campestris]